MPHTSHATDSSIRSRLAHPAGRGLVQGRPSSRSASSVGAASATGQGTAVRRGAVT